jgi:hypothetical protein
VIVIADGSKLGVATSIVVGPATLVTRLVTDASASPDEIAALRALGTEVIIVGRTATPVRPLGRLGAAGVPGHHATPAGRKGVTMGAFERIFAGPKPVIAMVHLPGLPGRPWHDRTGGMDRAVELAGRDVVEVLQAAGVDGLLFCNDRTSVPARRRAGDRGGDGRGRRSGPPRDRCHSA